MAVTVNPAAASSQSEFRTTSCIQKISLLPITSCRPQKMVATVTLAPKSGLSQLTPRTCIAHLRVAPIGIQGTDVVTQIHRNSIKNVSAVFSQVLSVVHEQFGRKKSYKRNSNIDFDGGKKEDLKIIFLLSGKIFTLNGGSNYFKLVKRSL